MCRIIDQNIKKCWFDSLDFQNFPGEYAPRPPPPWKARALPSQWSLRDHSLNHITSRVSRLQLSKSWHVCKSNVKHRSIVYTLLTHAFLFFFLSFSGPTQSHYVPVLISGTAGQKRKFFRNVRLSPPLARLATSGLNFATNFLKWSSLIHKVRD